jgi:hypothetical protein
MTGFVSDLNFREQVQPDRHHPPVFQNSRSVSNAGVAEAELAQIKLADQAGPRDPKVAQGFLRRRNHGSPLGRFRLDEPFVGVC